MKKRNLFVAAYLAMGVAVGFTSCSNDDVINEVTPGIEQGTDDTQVLTLKIASSGDGLTTRAGRPLLSSAAAQNIQQVALYFVQTSEGTNKDKVVLKKWVDWSSAVDYEDGKQLEISLKKENKQKLSDGKYTVYAVGYSGMSADGTDYTFTPTAMFSDEGNEVKESGDSWSAFQAVLKETAKYAEEVFAGELDLEVADGSFALQTNSGSKQAIVLHRQVAGATGYFDNVPVSVDGKNSRYVRLVASAKNNTVKFENFNSAFTSSKKSNAQYIVNGAGAATTADAKFANGSDAYVVYQIDLSKWFNYDPNYTGKGYKGYDYNGDGFLGSADVEKYIEDQKIAEEDLIDYSYNTVWRNPNKSKGQSVYRGTVFGAEFVVPIEYKNEQNTLQLQVTDADGNVLKYWNINVATDQLHKSASEPSYAGEKTDKSESIFNLYRNHMYSVGMKTDNTTPDKPDPDPSEPDPEKPDPIDPGEEPEDLSKGQDLIIQVNDNWEVIHRMEID